MTVGKKKCEKCGRSLRETEFFKMKSGERYRLCKDCLTQYIDNRDRSTFDWILKEFDVPYIKEKWVELTNKIYRRDPGKFGPKSVIGSYMRTMNMKQYEDIHYEHSADTLDEARAKAQGKEYKTQTITEILDKDDLKQKLEAGEISEAEYRTFTEPSSLGESIDFVDMDIQEEEKEEQKPSYIKDDAYWSNQLTQEDIDYLLLKWGAAYNPQQWITMETMYQKYAEEYDLNSDREEVLKKMCKTSLKMDENLDVGDITAYKNLATVFDQLRKSGKFTESQKKEEKREVLSTIGELAALCERQGGIIEKLPQYDPNQYPQDKIDFTIKDLKAYNYHLCAEELGLSDLIESYIEKLDKAERESIDLNEGLITSDEEAAANQLTDQDVQEFNAAMLENDVEAEAEELLRMIESGEV